MDSGESDRLVAENLHLKGKIDALQKELQNKFNVKQQQTELEQLIKTNQRLSTENTELTLMNRRLMEEID